MLDRWRSPRAYASAVALVIASSCTRSPQSPSARMREEKSPASVAQPAPAPTPEEAVPPQTPDSEQSSTPMQQPSTEQAKRKEAEERGSGGEEQTVTKSPAKRASKKAVARFRRQHSLTMRAGAVRLTGAKNARYEAIYVPDPSLKVAGLDRALRGRRISAEVKPFEQLVGQQRQREDVKQGGEIVAIALALQLQQGGWVVDMLEKASLRAGMSIPSGDTRTLATRLQVTGSVSFTVGDADALLEGKVRFAADDAQVAEVSQRAIAPLPRKGLRSKRYAKAANAALRSFVRQVIRDPRLGAALVAHLTRRAR